MATNFQLRTQKPEYGELDGLGWKIFGRKAPWKLELGIRSFAGPVHAFTIIELLVAMTVLALLVVMLMGLVNSATRLWRDNENRVDSYREARAAMGVISRDLSGIVSTSNKNYFLLNNFSPIAAISTAPKSTNTNGTLFFLTAMPKSAQAEANRSDVCQVGYFMAYGMSSAATNAPINTMNLYRVFLGSDDTYRLLTTVLNAPVFTNVQSLETDPNVELLARNIVQFKVEAFTNFPASANSPVTWGDFSQTLDSPIPKLLKIKIVAVNQETAKKLTQADWLKTNSAIMQQAMQTFETHVIIPDPQ